MCIRDRPQLVHFESGLKETRHRVVLADSITLTPGTITCQLEGDHYLVHCLDAAMVDGLDNGVFVEKLSQMEQKQDFMADSVTGEVQPENEAAEAETQATATVNEAAENEAPENDGDAEKEEEHEPVSYTHLDVYKRQEQKRFTVRIFGN